MDIPVEVTKCWVDPRTGKYGEKQHWMNPNVDSFEGMEAVYIKNNNQTVSCTKVFYSGRFITIIGTPEEVMEKCRQANLAFSIAMDIIQSGMTIKDFIKMNERINNVELT